MGVVLAERQKPVVNLAIYHLQDMYYDEMVLIVLFKVRNSVYPKNGRQIGRNMTKVYFEPML